MNNISADPKGSSSKRLPNIELLRILGMAILIFHHLQSQPIDYGLNLCN